MSKNKEKQIPSFRIYDKNKRQVPTLIHCFIKIIGITKDDYLSLQGFKFNKEFYEKVWDDSVHLPLAELENKESLMCAVSLQKHTYGSFAVIKPAREEEKVQR